MKKIGLLLMSIIPLATWSQQQFTISGSVRDVQLEVNKVYISYASNGLNVLDSTNVSGGRYSFQGLITQPTRVDLRAKYKNGETTVVSRDLITLFVEPSQISIDSKDSFSNATISGSSVNIEFQKLQAAAKPFEPRTSALLKEIDRYKKQKNESALEQAQKQMDQLNAEMKEAVYANYIRQNPSSPLAFFALQQFSGAIIPNPKESLELFNLLSEKMKTSHDGQRMQSLIQRSIRASVGNSEIDFSQTDINGNTITLSSLKGKTVLINFWASWCGPCRALDPKLIQLYNRFKDNDFTIINVSLDKPGAKQDWLDAVKESGIGIYPQVSDLRFWNNAAAQAYGVAALPQNILIDAQGTIAGRNLKPVELAEKIASLTKK
ncbi:MAG: TlpA disulfide reductase family protein [Arachidicoccus sp.]|nr:TlpA disulfide reductase family protein [Arachidicoccus sp.]